MCVYVHTGCSCPFFNVLSLTESLHSADQSQVVCQLCLSSYLWYIVINSTTGDVPSDSRN